MNEDIPNHLRQRFKIEEEEEELRRKEKSEAHLKLTLKVVTWKHLLDYDESDLHDWNNVLMLQAIYIYIIWFDCVRKFGTSARKLTRQHLSDLSILFLMREDVFAHTDIMRIYIAITRLYCNDSSESVQVNRNMTFNELKNTIRETADVQADDLRIWTVIKRKNGTIRPEPPTRCSGEAQLRKKSEEKKMLPFCD